jgi:hypothetical protein
MAIFGYFAKIVKNGGFSNPENGENPNRGHKYVVIPAELSIV